MDKIEKAWSIEADTIRISDDWNNIPFYRNKLTDEFVNTEDKFFIIAAKGLGKTLLLKIKSHKYRKERKASVVYPRGELCEKIRKPGEEISFSSADLVKFKSEKQWKSIWELCILITIMKLYELEMPTELSLILKKASSISDILNILLQERGELHKYSSLLATDLYPAIRDITESSAIFIDNVDEAMEEHTGYYLKNSRENKHNSEEVWINAQLGLMQAIKDIHFANKHIKIYATIRIEAYNKNISSTALQMANYCTELAYKKNELKEIFVTNVNLTKEEELYDKNNSNPFIKLLGIDKIEHKFVKQNDIKYVEDTFDYIYRHTYGRPRELVQIGLKLKEEEPELRSKMLDEIVNKESSRLFEQYKKEIIPYFDDEEYNLFCCYVNSNVITRKDVEEISNRICSDNNEYRHIFCSFYKKGLLGYVVKHFDNTSTQKFLKV